MKRSLSFIVASGLVALATVLVGIYSLVDYVQERRDRMQRLDDLAKLQIDEIRVALEEPVWNIDGAQIEKVIDAMAVPQFVYALHVNAAGKAYGRERDAHWRLVRRGARPLPRGLFVYRTPITFARSRIGEAVLYVSPRFVDEELRALRMRLLGIVVLTDAILVAAVYLLIAMLVLRPVQAIERYAAAVSSGARHEPPAVTTPATELANLQQSIDTMVRELEARQDRFQSLFESVNDAILVRDPNTAAILEANRRTCEMFGYTRDELLRLEPGALSSCQGVFTAETALELIRSATAEPAIYEWEARHRDGRTFLLEVSMRLAEIAGVPRVIMVSRDITERRAMEQALRVSERMSAIGGLVAGVAHEVRNPLFGISATLDAFEAEFGTSEATSEYMAVLRRDVSRLTRLMNDLLDYARPQQLARHVQPLEPVIDETIRVCTAVAREKNIRIDRRIAEPLPLAVIDADRILQVLKNLVENAIAFSGSGTTVTLAAHAEDSEIVIVIADEGSGFREEDLPHLFEPFFTRRRGGNGLGLPIAEKIVRDHGGKLVAMNNARGASIEVRLPAVVAARAAG